jgi:hypothetical protein
MSRVVMRHDESVCSGWIRRRHTWRAGRDAPGVMSSGVIDACVSMCQHVSMRRLSRFLLILVLTVSLPVRGYAASIMMVCGASGQAVVEHSAEGASHHHGGHGGQLPDDAHQHAHSDHAADSGNQDHDSATCSACGVCCAGVLFASSSTVSANGAVSSGPIAFFDRRLVGFIPAGLDRPPLVLAR